MSQIKSLFYMILFDSQQFRELFGLSRLSSDVNLHSTVIMKKGDPSIWQSP